METRKLQLVGSRSFAICLPKEWVQRNKLGKKDSVYVETTDNNELVVRTARAQKLNSQRIRVSVDRIDNLPQFLVFCYVKNVRLIRLYSKELSYETVRQVRSVLRYLEGYDITNESENEIEISFLFYEVDINMRRVLQRIIYLTRLQISALENKDFPSMDENEIAIDRLYHLSKRILFECIHNFRMRQENDISNEEDIFFLKDITKKLENIADCIFQLREIALTEQDTRILREHVQYLDAVLSRKTPVKDLREALEHITPQSEHPTVNSTLQRIHQLCRDVLENFISIEFDRLYFGDENIVRIEMQEAAEITPVSQTTEPHQ